MHYNDGFSQRTYWTPDEVRSRFDELEAGNIKHGPSDGRVSEQHHLQTHLGNPDWVKGYQDQPHQSGPTPQEGAPTHYERTHPNGFVERQSADLVNKVLRTGDPRGKEQWHMDEHGNVHTNHEDGTSGVFKPVTASGLGMPDGPMNLAQDPNAVDQAVDPVPGAIKPEVQSFEQFMAPVPTNQTTTKPRQMPGGGGSAPGLGGDVTMDPATNGSDLGENTESAQPPSDDLPPTQARRHQAYILADVMADVLEANPTLGERTAYLLAKRAVEEFDLVKQADSEGWNPLNYGNRGKVPDASINIKVPRVGRVPVPAESPSRHQPTVQPEHQRAISGSPAGGGAIDSPASPKGLPPGNDPLSPLDFILDEDDERYSQTIKMRQGDDQVWRAARKAAQR